MKSISFYRGVGVALVLSIVASVCCLVTTMFFGADAAIRITISAVTLGYILHLLNHADAGIGKFSIVSLYVFSAALLLLLWPITLDHALFSVAAIWMVRTLCFHKRFIYALFDLAFSAVSFVAAIAAVLQSHSVFISFWSFFLAQAFILPVLNYYLSKYSDSLNQSNSSSASHQRFYQAHNSAQNALRKLAASA